MDSTIEAVPPIASLSSSVLSFLNVNFQTRHDLLRAPALASELHTQWQNLEQSLIDLNQRLGTGLLAYASRSDQIHIAFGDVNSKLIGHRTSDGGTGAELETLDKVSEEHLLALAKEVVRVEAVRMYAETALKLNTLVGDIEDAVSSAVKQNVRKQPSTENPEEARLAAIKALKLAEDVLNSVTKARPQWARLVLAVDLRVDRALAILRPQAIADYRSLLVTLGWPPPLSTSDSKNLETKKSTDVSNPLFTIQGDLKHQYCVNFLALCSLQELQRQRKYRQFRGHDQDVAIDQPLWVIEELVNPLSIASQRHFSKWVDKPEFIFALVFKITRDYVDSMDDLLQPLVDEAMLSGYSCREEWISAMVTSLSTHLAKEVFPLYVGQLDKGSEIETQSQARISWLHLLDLMIDFDKKVKSLVLHSGVLLSVEEDGNLQRISSLSVFCDRPDWLDLWAEIELSDAIAKLKPEIDVERRWSIEVQGSASEDHRSPVISSSFIRQLSSVVERCRSLPTILLRSRFIRLAGAPIIQMFLDCLFLRCQEAEGLTALADDDALVKVTTSINAAYYIESVLKEWCEDVFFLEMGLNQIDELRVSVIGDSSGGVMDEEIGKLEMFRAEWVEKLSTVVLRGFDALCREYMKNKKRWQEKIDESWDVSKSFIGALDHLQGKVSVLEKSLNKMDFVGVWRSLAKGIDLLIFNGILMSNAKFYGSGVERLGNDLEVLFGVFRAWCLRPEVFFPKVNEGLKLLKTVENQFQGSVAGGEMWLKQNGIRHLGAPEVEKIVKSRMYDS